MSGDKTKDLSTAAFSRIRLICSRPFEAFDLSCLDIVFLDDKILSDLIGPQV
jgi:hypothetical protein